MNQQQPRDSSNPVSSRSSSSGHTEQGAAALRRLQKLLQNPNLASSPNLQAQIEPLTLQVAEQITNKEALSSLLALVKDVVDNPQQQFIYSRAILSLLRRLQASLLVLPRVPEGHVDYPRYEQDYIQAQAKFEALLDSLMNNALHLNETIFLVELFAFLDDDKKQFLFRRAIMMAKADLIEQLLKLSEPPNVTADIYGNTAYHYVRDAETFFVLQEYITFSLDTRNAQHETPLQTIIQDTTIADAEKRAMVALFCEFGADPALQTPANEDAFTLALQQAQADELTFILKANRQYLVLMRQIELLSAQHQRTRVIALLKSHKPKATRDNFNQTYPVDYMPMPILGVDDAAIAEATEVILFAINHQLYILLQALLLLRTKEDVFSKTDRLIASVEQHKQVFLYAAMRNNNTRHRASGVIAKFILEKFYYDGLVGSDYLRLAELAIIDNDKELIEMFVSKLESGHSHLAIAQYLDPVMVAMRAGHIALVQNFQVWGYSVELRHLAVAATTAAVTAQQLQVWIKALPTSSKTPLSALQIRSNNTLDVAKKVVLENAGCRVFEPGNDAPEPSVTRLRNYGSMLANLGVNSSRRHAQDRRDRAIALQVMPSSLGETSASSSSSFTAPLAAMSSATSLSSSSRRVGETTSLLSRK